MVWAGGLGVLIVALSKKMQQLLIIIPFTTLLNSLLILKMQGYNSFGSALLVLTLLSLTMLIVAISTFNYKVL